MCLNSKQTDPLKALVIDNKLLRWWQALQKDVQRRRGEGVPVKDVYVSLMDYVAGGIQNLYSMVKCGVFRSMVIEQSLEILEKDEFSKTCQSVAETIQMYSHSHRLPQRGFNPYVRASHAFWCLFYFLGSTLSR